MDCQLRFGDICTEGHPSATMCPVFIQKVQKEMCVVVWFRSRSPIMFLSSLLRTRKVLFLAKLCDLMKFTKIFNRGIINLLAWRILVLFKTSPVFFHLGPNVRLSSATHPTVLCLPVPPKGCHPLLYMISEFLSQLVLTFFSHCLYKNTYEITL